MEPRTLLADTSGVRLDIFISARLNITRAAAQKLIKNGGVTKHGKALKQNYITAAGDCIQAVIPLAPPSVITPQNIALNILYEDTHIIVVNKPRGMVTHQGAGNLEGTLVNALLYHCGGLAAADTPRPGIVHRIDKDTSGAIVAAKTDEAYHSLVKQFSEHTITRRYIALARGILKNDSGIIDKPIGRHPNNRVKMTVVKKGGKHAVTRYEVIRRFKKYTLISVVLETGRTHQIRVHFADMGHSLAGDGVYGSPLKNEPEFCGQALHALTLGFTHPVTQERMVFTAKLPFEFLELINKIKT